MDKLIKIPVALVGTAVLLVVVLIVGIGIGAAVNPGSENTGESSESYQQYVDSLPKDENGQPIIPETTEQGQKVVAEAMTFLGKPYVWGGNNPAVGTDCSGLVMFAYKAIGVNLPHRADSQAKMSSCMTIPSVDQAIPGDIISYSRNGGQFYYHTSLYLGGGKIIHAPQVGQTIKIGSLSNFDGKTKSIKRCY